MSNLRKWIEGLMTNLLPAFTDSDKRKGHNRTPNKKYQRLLPPSV